MRWSQFADPSCIKAKFKERAMPDTNFHNIFHNRKKKSCHLSNNYNKVTKRLKWYISKFRLKPNVCFYSIAIIMIIVNFFLETNTHVRERTLGSKFDSKAYHKLHSKAMKT